MVLYPFPNFYFSLLMKEKQDGLRIRIVRFLGILI